MTVKSAQQWSGLVVCKDSTGALATPSVGPAGALYVDGTVNGAGVTISGSNPYKWTVTLPALTAGQCVSLYITATIATVATASVVREDVADTKRVSDLNDSSYAGGAVASVTGDVAGKVLGGGISTITATGVQATLADDAITSAKFDESTAYPVKAADTGATQIARVGADSDTLETISDQVDALSLGSLSLQNVRDAMKLAPSSGAPAAGSIDDHLDDMPADVWTNATRTLTSTAAQTNSAVSGAAITGTIGVTLSWTLTGLTISATRTKLLFTAKQDLAAADSTALLQIQVSNPASGTTDGLLYIDGVAATAGQRVQASLVESVGAGTLLITVADDLMALFTAEHYVNYDVKQFVTGGTSSILTSGKFETVFTPSKTV